MIQFTNFIKLTEIFEANANIKGAVIFNSTCYILGNYLKERGMQKSNWLDTTLLKEIHNCSPKGDNCIDCTASGTTKDMMVLNHCVIILC